MQPNIDICASCKDPIIGTVFSPNGEELCSKCYFLQKDESSDLSGTYNSLPSKDMVNRPPHYNTSGIECIDAMKAMCDRALVEPHAAYCWQNTFKYLWRWPYKNGLEDLKKARWYLDRLIEEISDEHV